MAVFSATATRDLRRERAGGDAVTVPRSALRALVLIKNPENRSSGEMPVPARSGSIARTTRAISASSRWNASMTRTPVGVRVAPPPGFAARLRLEQRLAEEVGHGVERVPGGLVGEADGSCARRDAAFPRDRLKQPDALPPDGRRLAGFQRYASFDRHPVA